MSNGRLILYLLLSIFVVAGAHVMLSYKNVHILTAGNRDRLLSSAVKNVKAVTIYGGESSPIKLEYDGAWKIVEPYAIDADESVVYQMLDQLFACRLGDSINLQEAKRIGRELDDFGLAPAKIAIMIEYGDGNSESIEFGEPTPAANGIYCRIKGIDAVFVVDGEASECINHPVTWFRRRVICTLAVDDIESFDIRRPSTGLMHFDHDGLVWRVNGRATRDTMDKMLHKLFSTQVQSFVLPDAVGRADERISPSVLAGYGLDAEHAVCVSFRCFDGRSEQLLFGDSHKDDGVYVTTGVADSVVILPNEVLAVIPENESALIDDRAFAINVGDVNELRILNGKDEYAFINSKDGVWNMVTPITMAVSERNFNTLLNRVLSLRRSEIVTNGMVVSVSTNLPSITISRERILGQMEFEDLCGDMAFSAERIAIRKILVMARDGNEGARIVYDDENADEAIGIAALDAICELKATRVEKLIATTGDMQRFGLTEPTFTIVIDFKRSDQIRRSIKIGERTEGGYYASVGASGTVFVLPDSVVLTLVR